MKCMVTEFFNCILLNKCWLFVVPLPGKTSTSGWYHCGMLLLLLSNTNHEYIIQYSWFWMLNAHSSLPFHFFSSNCDESSPIDNVFGIQYFNEVCLFVWRLYWMPFHSMIFRCWEWYFFFNHKSIPNKTVSTNDSDAVMAQERERGRSWLNYIKLLEIEREIPLSLHKNWFEFLNNILNFWIGKNVGENIQRHQKKTKEIKK